MKYVLKTVFFLLFILLIKHGISMDSPDDRLYSPDKRSSKNHVFYVVPLRFHDLNHYAQTCQSNYKMVQQYFKSNWFVVDYFQELHQIMTMGSTLDQRDVWDLAIKGATYEPDDQSWLLNYAKYYITNHFLVPTEKKVPNPQFHQWIYIIRTFQGCDATFNGDLFVLSALEKYLFLSFQSLSPPPTKPILLRKPNCDWDFNPSIAIKDKLIVSLNSHMKRREHFIGKNNSFWFLLLYQTDRQIYNAGCRSFGEVKSPANDRLQALLLYTYRLLMRRTTVILKSIICDFLRNENKTLWWCKSASTFLEAYKDWLFRIPLEDDDMRREVMSLSNVVERTWLFLSSFSNEPAQEAKNPAEKRQVRNRKATSLTK